MQIKFFHGSLGCGIGHGRTVEVLVTPVEKFKIRSTRLAPGDSYRADKSVRPAVPEPEQASLSPRAADGFEQRSVSGFQRSSRWTAALMHFFVQN